MVFDFATQYLSKAHGLVAAKSKKVVEAEESDDGPQTEGGSMILNEGKTGGVQEKSRKAYQAQPIRKKGETRPETIAKYEAGDHWRLASSSDEWVMEAMGPRVWLKALYLWQKDGRGPIKGTAIMDGIEEK